MFHVRSERTEHDAAAAGDVEHRVVSPRLRRSDDVPQRLFVGEARRDVEHFGLTRELIDNSAVVRRFAYVLALLVTPPNARTVAAFKFAERRRARWQLYSYSGLMLANFTTLAHFSASLVMNFPSRQARR